MKHIGLIIVVAIVANLFMYPLMISAGETAQETIEEIDIEEPPTTPQYPTEPVERFPIDMVDNFVTPTTPVVPEPVLEEAILRATLV